MASHNRSGEHSTDPSARMILPRPFTRQNSAVLVAGYVLLDWISYIRPLHDLNITPWNPAPALGLLFLIRYGKPALLPLVVALLLADLLVRGIQHMPVGLFLSAGLGIGYFWISALLVRHLPTGDIFQTLRHLLAWGLIIIFGTLATSSVYVLTHWLLGFVPTPEIVEAIQRHWVGDAVGILVSMPILSMITDPQGRADVMRFIRHVDFIVVATSTAIALWVAFGLGAKAEFKYLYVLFLPIAFAAARHRVEGAVTAAALMQIGIIGSVQYLKLSAVTIVEIQWLVLVLAIFGFFIGVVVADRERVSMELRQTLRVAAAGEMAAALAHELNQPLTALTAYGAACEKMLARGDSPEKVSIVVRSLVTEAFRAGDIVRRLRDFFRFGSSSMEPIGVSRLIEHSLASFKERASAEQIVLDMAADTILEVNADRLQIEVVLRNLLANAFDAVKLNSPDSRRVAISVAPYGHQMIAVSVIDSGPGIDPEISNRLFEPFQTTKASGMGLGLAVSRALIESHGGALWYEPGTHGCFKFTLPLSAKLEHDQ